MALQPRTTRFLIFLIVITSLSIGSGLEFSKMWKAPDIYHNPEFSTIVPLSNWFAGIQNTPMDTPVFVFSGEHSGGKVLILGGNHSNEPAATLSIITLIESIRVEAGTVYLIPWANASAVTHSDPMEGAPQFYSIALPDGKTRTFRFGSRNTNPIHQWPDPTVYFHPMGGQLGGQETRNLNRSFPGRPDGNRTEQLAYAILQLIKTERIDLLIDLHESSPEYPVNNAIVFHQDAAEVAIFAQMELEMYDIAIGLEESPVNLRGLSHRELGDASEVQAILLEVSNPSQGRMRGKTDEALVVTGKDKFYVAASNRNQLFVPYDESGYSIDLRVARHIAAISALIDAWNLLNPDLWVQVEQIPHYERMIREGLGVFLVHP